jgi:hypothetical protein
VQHRLGRVASSRELMTGRGGRHHMAGQARASVDHRRRVSVEGGVSDVSEWGAGDKSIIFIDP